MKNLTYITITTFQGETMSGFEVISTTELPKSAKLLTYTYDQAFQAYARYIMIGKKTTKYFLRKTI